MLKNQNGVIHIIAAIGTVLLLIGLAVGVFLIQKQTTLKSKASSNIIQALEMKDSNNNPIVCDGNKNPPECNISTQEISIKVKDLELLTK